MPPAGWRLRIATLSILNVGLFFVLLFIAAERLPGGLAAAAGAVGHWWPWCSGGRSSDIVRAAFELWAGALRVAGVAALVLGHAASLDAIGVAAAVGSAASMATGTVLARRWGRPPLSIVCLTAWQLTIGGLVVLPCVLLLSGLPPAPTARNVVGFIVMGLFGTASSTASGSAA